MGALATRVSDEGRSVLAIPKVKQFVERMVEGAPLADAAKQCGLRTRRARLLLLNPAVRRAYFKGIEDLLTAERARNVRLRVSVRQAVRRRRSRRGRSLHGNRHSVDRFDGYDAK